jgi:hypothetical protein
MWTTRIGERDLVLQCLGRCVSIYTGCGICDGYEISFPHSWCPHCSMCVFSDILASNWLWPAQKRAETCSCFLQQFQNIVVLRRTFIHLISTIIKSHNGDDDTKGWCHQSFESILSALPKEHSPLNCRTTSSDISGYHAEFHEGFYQKHTNPLNCKTSNSDISGYHADFHDAVLSENGRDAAWQV